MQSRQQSTRRYTGQSVSSGSSFVRRLPTYNQSQLSRNDVGHWFRIFAALNYGTGNTLTVHQSKRNKCVASPSLNTSWKGMKFMVAGLRGECCLPSWKVGNGSLYGEESKRDIFQDPRKREGVASNLKNWFGNKKDIKLEKKFQIQRLTRKPSDFIRKDAHSPLGWIRIQKSYQTEYIPFAGSQQEKHWSPSH